MKRSPWAVADAVGSRRQRLLIVLVAVLAAIGFAAVPASAHTGPLVYSGLTSTAPTIDGVLSPGEWASATSFPITFGPHTGTAYVMNDGVNLYVAATINDSSVGNLNSFQMYFDNNNDGVQTLGDDVTVTNAFDSAFDDYFSGCCYLFDASDGGANDVTGYGQPGGAVVTFETAHPLCSDDGLHDICVSGGQTVGFDFGYQPGGPDGGVSTSYPAPAPEMQSAYGDLVIAQAPNTPSLTVSATPSVLTAKNHQLVPISISVSASSSDGPVSVRLVSIQSNEPDNGTGDGDQPNDIQGATYGAFDTSFLLRSERSGNGNGRVYTITYKAVDAAGNQTTAKTTVTVPH